MLVSGRWQAEWRAADCTGHASHGAVCLRLLSAEAAAAGCATDGRW